MPSSLALAVAEARRFGAVQGGRGLGAGKDLHAATHHGLLAVGQRQHVRRAVFTDDHEGARLAHDCAAGAAGLRAGIALFAAALGFAVEAADGGAETDADLRQRQNLGLAGVANLADDRVGPGHLAELVEQFLHEELEIHVVKGTTSVPPRQSEIEYSQPTCARFVSQTSTWCSAAAPTVKAAAMG